jgi:hypothetical protein
MVYNRTIKFDMDTEELSQLIQALKIEEEAGSKDSETRVLLEDISDIEDLDLDRSDSEELDLIRRPEKRKRVVSSEESLDQRGSDERDSSDERSDDGQLPSIRVSRRTRPARDDAEWAYY